MTPGTTDVIAGTDQTFTFTPDAGYQVGDVVVDGASVGAPASYTFEDVTAAHTLAVTFVPADDNHPTCVVRGWKAGWSNRPVKLQHHRRDQPLRLRDRPDRPDAERLGRRRRTAAHGSRSRSAIRA